MKYFFVVLMCCLVGIQKTSAACINPSPMSNFNETAFVMKPWYIVGSTSSTTDTCRKFDFTKGTGLLNINYTSGTLPNTTTTSCTWTPVAASPGKYDQRCPVSSTTSDVLSILGTDYNTYFVIHRCITLFFGNIDFYELWSTNPTGYTTAFTNQGTLIPATPALSVINNNCTLPAPATGNNKFMNLFNFMG